MSDPLIIATISSIIIIAMEALATNIKVIIKDRWIDTLEIEGYWFLER